MKKIFEKKDLRLKEDYNGSSSTYVTSDKAGASTANIASDVNKAHTKNPNEKDFTVNSGDYNGNSSDDNLNIQVNGNNAASMQQNLNKQMANPVVKKAVENGKATINYHFESVMFTKGELNEIFKNL